MTPNIIISSTFDEVSDAIKKKSCGKINKTPVPPARLSRPVPNPVPCPVVSDDVQFKLQISNLKSLGIIYDALHSNSLLKMIFKNETSVFIPKSCVSDNSSRHERPRMTTNTTTVPPGIIPIPLR